MATLIKQVRIIDPAANVDLVEDVFISREEIAIAPKALSGRYLVMNGKDRLLVPGLVDLHVHFREPGFSYKEDIASGIRAALAGGVTSALVMPNTMPAIDCPKLVDYQLKRAAKKNFDLMVAGAASLALESQELTTISDLKTSGVKAITDDGKPILSDEHMKSVLKACRRHDLVCMQHAEDTRISCGHSLNAGEASARLHIGGQEGRAESDLVFRDVALAEQIQARYHVLHLSCARSLKIVGDSKRRRVRVTCEVAPHHLLLSERDIHELDGNKKMNPPLRSDADRDALIQGIHDGIIDAVASDHAPHHRREKKLPFVRAPFGVVGVETTLLVLLTLVRQRKISLHQAIKLMTAGPAQVLNEGHRIGTMAGERALKNAVLIDPAHCFKLTERHLVSRSKNSAFLGMELWGRVLATFFDGRIVYSTRGI